MQEGLSNLGAAPAFDEGGNFIDVRFGPLTRIGDYRLPDTALVANIDLADGLPPVVAAPPQGAPAVPFEPAPESTAVFVQCPGDVDGDAVPDGAVNPNVKCMHISGGDGFISMADGRRLYMFGYSDLTGTPPGDAISQGTLAANFPSPTIALAQGQEFYLTLTNVGMAIRPDLFDPHTVHFHGFPNQAPVFDGMPEASFGVNMGASLTYYYNVTEPGTYMYHCHQEATEHMQMGMLGNLYVTPAQDGTLLNGYTKFVYNDGDGSTGYSKAYPLQLSAMDHNFHNASETIQPLPFANMKDTYAMINGRGYPDSVIDAVLPGPIMDDGSEGVKSQPVSSLITLNRATEGNTLLLRLSDLSVTNFYTLTALGLPMRVVGGGAAIARGPSPDGVAPGKDLYYRTNSVTLGGGEAAEVIIDAAGVPAGTYFLYTTNLNYLSNNNEDYGGMMTEIVIQ
jgi:FtsP/CotA-like multicopper oxidase with cupredoxin domain